MGYTFNGSTGNLTSRTGMLSQTETFGYDNVDRLVSIQHGSTTAMTLTYGANGNITSKTGIGTYSYGTKPHAVTNVTNSSSLIDTDSQSITYTAFDKAASITQNGYQLDITYGTDLQRWKSVLKNGSTTVRTTLYAGDYEKITENGVTKQYYYIHGGNGLAALYVKQSNASDQVYYPCTDHLGSIIKLVDANGSSVYNATYDAWGQQTVTTNTLNFHRGYTGHEHLSQFALINMNGRMYDPLLGRFLSPDPFVQLPDFSQNFNRYSYCLNNPLVYVDPDGEFIWVIAGAAIIGGVWNTVNNWDAICEGGFGTFAKYFGVGALAGGLGAATGVGTAALLGTSTGFAAGAIIGAASGGVGGFTLGGGNALAAGGGWSKFWSGASTGFTTGIVSGSIMGGVTGGLDAMSNGKNFWSGENIASGRSVFSFNNEPIPAATRHKPTATIPNDMPMQAPIDEELVSSHQLSSNEYLIHYTSEKGYNSIMNEQRILPSTGIKHARYGDGQYLTNIDATQFTKWQVSRRLYGVPWKTSTLTHYIKIDVSGLNVIQNGIHNYYIPNTGPLNLNNRVIDSGITIFRIKF